MLSKWLVERFKRDLYNVNLNFMYVIAIGNVINLSNFMLKFALTMQSEDAGVNNETGIIAFSLINERKKNPLKR